MTQAVRGPAQDGPVRSHAHEDTIQQMRGGAYNNRGGRGSRFSSSIPLRLTVKLFRSARLSHAPSSPLCPPPPSPPWPTARPCHPAPLHLRTPPYLAFRCPARLPPPEPYSAAPSPKCPQAPPLYHVPCFAYCCILILSLVCYPCKHVPVCPQPPSPPWPTAPSAASRARKPRAAATAGPTAASRTAQRPRAGWPAYGKHRHTSTGVTKGVRHVHVVRFHNGTASFSAWQMPLRAPTCSELMVLDSCWILVLYSVCTASSCAFSSSILSSYSCTRVRQGGFEMLASWCCPHTAAVRYGRVGTVGRSVRHRVAMSAHLQRSAFPHHPIPALPHLDRRLVLCASDREALLQHPHARHPIRPCTAATAGNPLSPSAQRTTPWQLC